MPHPVIITDRFGQEYTLLTIPDGPTPEIDEHLRIAADEFQRAAVRLYGKASSHTIEEIERNIGETISANRKLISQNFSR